MRYCRVLTCSAPFPCEEHSQHAQEPCADTTITDMWVPNAGKIDGFSVVHITNCAPASCSPPYYYHGTTAANAMNILCNGWSKGEAERNKHRATQQFHGEGYNFSGMFNKAAEFTSENFERHYKDTKTESALLAVVVCHLKQPRQCAEAFLIDYGKEGSIELCHIVFFQAHVKEHTKRTAQNPC